LAAIFCIGAAAAVLLSGALVTFHLLAGNAFPQWHDQWPLLWPVPFAVLVQLTASGLRYHAIRMQRFTAVATARVARSVVFVVGSTSIALLWPHAGGHGAPVLLGCQIAGDLLALLIQFRSNGRAAWLALLRPRFWQSLGVTRRYARMLGAMTASQILGDLCQQMTVWTATFAFGAAQAGLYVLAFTIVSVPSVILAAPLGDVLFQRLSRRHAEREPLAPLVIRSTLIPSGVPSASAAAADVRQVIVPSDSSPAAMTTRVAAARSAVTSGR
jgi:O-antigen/teichoic acid export membrane protein